MAESLLELSLMARGIYLDAALSSEAIAQTDEGQE